jgi:ATP-dependent RNA helicase RhlB
MRLASQWMSDPVVLEVEPEQVTVDTVDQRVLAVSSQEKFPLLYNLLQKPEFRRVLIFGNRRDSTQRLADRLHRHGVACELLSGAVTQNKRVKILEDFREGRINVLVATDVAGRGLHVDGISHVINYDFPYEADDYVHRIGRTGRAGVQGTAISFACEDESFIIPDIESYIGRALPCSMPEEGLLAPPPRAADRGERPRAERADRVERRPRRDTRRRRSSRG